MKLILKLAIRNLLGAGLRTWLNVIVLSFSFVLIIAAKGILVGWDRQARNDMHDWEIGDGQYWNENYDLYDPFSLEEAHAEIPQAFESEIMAGTLVPVLMTRGTIYPEGRMQSVMIKGIPPEQTVLEIPTTSLEGIGSAIPAIIGQHMASSNKLSVGDYVTIRWRDKNGTFDAAEIVITEIFKTNVPTVDLGQVWISLNSLQEMTLLENQATLFSYIGDGSTKTDVGPWLLKTDQVLLQDIENMIKMKSKGQSVFYSILLLLALLAIFDTQVLSIFRRQKEIGTYVALGYTRYEVVWLFTVEGAMHALLAALVGAVYGIPLLTWLSVTGISLGASTAEYGFAIADTMYPVYSAALVTGTILAVFLCTAFVSYLPSRKIAKMNPTEALRGKLQ